MPRQASTVVRMDDEGRLTIPKAVRETLDIDDVTASLALDITVKERGVDDDN